MSSTRCPRQSTPCAACAAHERNGERVWVSAIDPLNLAGVVLPGDRVPAQAGKGILFVDGLPQEEEAPVVTAPLTTRIGVRSGALTG